MRSPQLDGAAVLDLPVRNLSSTFLQGFVGGATPLLAGLAPLLVPAQPLDGQVAALGALPGARAERVRADRAQGLM